MPRSAEGSTTSGNSLPFAAVGTRIFPHHRDRCVTAKEIRVASSERFGQTRRVDPQMATQSGIRRLLIFLVTKGLDPDWSCKVSLICADLHLIWGRDHLSI